MKKMVIICGVLGTAFSVVFVGISDAPSIVLACYRMILAAILSAPMILVERNQGTYAAQTLHLKDYGLCILSGIFLGMHFFLYFESLNQTNIASAVVLVDTELIFVSLAGMLLLQERLSIYSWIGILVAFTGSVIVAAGDLKGGSLLGDVLALGGALCSAGYTIIGRKCRKQMGLGKYTTLVYLSACMITGGMACLSGKGLLHYGVRAWLAALGLAVVCTILGHTIFSWGLKYEKASFISTVKLLEPVFASILGVFFFREIPSVSSVFGGCVILGGILICIWANRDREQERRVDQA